MSETFCHTAIMECVGGMVHHSDAGWNGWFLYLEVSWLNDLDMDGTQA